MDIMTKKEAPKRIHLPDEREGMTRCTKIGNMSGPQLAEKLVPIGETHLKVYIRTGEFEDGDLAEVFLTPDKEGSFISGILDGFATALSIALQHGVPLDVFVDKFINTRFEPSGATNDDMIPMASSFFDYMFRKLALKYLDEEECRDMGIVDKSKLKQEMCNDEEAGEDSRVAGRTTVGLSGKPFDAPNGKKERGAEEAERSCSDAKDVPRTGA